MTSIASRTAKNPPRFTIAIPTFNRAHWLPDCVRSALAQTFDLFEVVVSDNASQDNTAEILAQLSHERLVVIRQQRNVGPIANWNACLSAARGEYIVMLSDDDSVAPHLLERCSRLIEENGDISVVVALGDVVEPHGLFRRPATTSQRLKSGLHDGSLVLLEYLRGRISPMMCTIAIRTDVLRAQGGFPSDWPHTGDIVSWLPLLLDGEVGFVNERCGTYCTHEATQTARFSLDITVGDIDRLARLIVDKAERRISDPALLSEIRLEARRFVARNCVGHIGMARRKGGARKEIAFAVWKWRHRLTALTPRDLTILARPLVLFVLPQWTIEYISRMKRTRRANSSLDHVAAV